MNDRSRPKQELIKEMAELRQRISEHEASEREHKKAVEELRLHSEIMEHMAEGVYLVDLHDLMIRYTNPKFEKMFGYGPGEMVGEHVSIVNVPTDKDTKETAREITEVIHKTGEWHGEVNNMKKDGTSFWCYANVSVFNHPKYGEVMVAVHADITEHKEAEAELQKARDELEMRVEERTKELKQRTHDLDERVKELNCLFGISELVEKPGITLEDILQGMAEMIPASWQYPEITCARISYEGFEYCTASFGCMNSKWKQSGDIIVHGEKMGCIEVCYLEERPEEAEGPFLREERNLLDAVCERVGKIIERKKSEKLKMLIEQKEVLLQEVYHRVKNNLCVMSDILYLQMESIEDIGMRRLFEESMKRMESIALIHEKLYLSKSVENVEFLGYVQDLASSLIDAYSLNRQISLTTSDNRVDISSRNAVPCALIANELITNSLKHAFPEGFTPEEGACRITIEIKKEKDNIVLTVADNGIGIPEETELEKTESFGLKLVNLFIKQLQGTVDIQRSKGTRFTVMFHR